MLQCKNIPDRPVLEFLHQLNRAGTWFWTDDFKPENSVLRAMPPGTPVKLARAKMGVLIRRGLVNGCTCGCRGDYELTDKGHDWLAHAATKERT